MHGLSNDVLDMPWSKVKKGTKRLAKALQKQNVEAEELFNILIDTEQANEKDLPDTGVGKEMERILSPLFIESPQYGTRSMTVLSIDNDNNIMFTEKSLVTEKIEWWSTRFSFSVI
nr:NRDE family protein [Aneurinibacillus aneurinilyticus]